MLSLCQLLPEKSLLQSLATSNNLVDPPPPPPSLNHNHNNKTLDVTFDYDAFWNDALVKARTSLQQEQANTRQQQQQRMLVPKCTCTT